MSKIIKSIILLLAIMAFNSNVFGEEFDIGSVIELLKNEINFVRGQETGLPKIKINSVELELSTITTRSANGGLKVNVAGIGMGFGSGVEKENTQLIKLLLLPKGNISISREGSLGLADAIIEVKKGLKYAYNKEPKFNMKEFIFQVDFALEKEANGNINFGIIEIGGIKKLNKATHKIIVKMSLN